jgi:AMP phosphorylase
MPKTASRSISSAAGTADCMEVLSPVGFTLPEIKKILEKTGAVIAWEGKFDLCPVDNTIIKIEHALSINPEGIMIASILSKKKSAGATHLVIDVPVGSKMKVKDKESGERLAKKLITISKSLGIKARALLTDGEVPCGRAFGASLEAREVLRILEGRYFDNLADKACLLAGELLELAGRCKEGEGTVLAKETLLSGKALLKMQEIIKAQGGTITSSDQINDAKYKTEIFATMNGKIDGWDIEVLTKLARNCGAPEDKGAGVLLCRYVGEQVKKGDKILEIYSNSQDKLSYAEKYYEESNPLRFESIILEEIE